MPLVTRIVGKTYPKRCISWTHSWHAISAETAVSARGRRSREKSMVLAGDTEDTLRTHWGVLAFIGPIWALFGVTLYK